MTLDQYERLNAKLDNISVEVVQLRVDVAGIKAVMNNLACQDHETRIRKVEGGWVRIMGQVLTIVLAILTLVVATRIGG